MEIIFSILTISILLSVTRKFWFCFHEQGYNTNRRTIKMQELYYDQGGFYKRAYTQKLRQNLLHRVVTDF